jgi:hypothetical protein
MSLDPPQGEGKIAQSSNQVKEANRVAPEKPASSPAWASFASRSQGRHGRGRPSEALEGEILGKPKASMGR